MELVSEDDHAGNSVDIPFCGECADHNGNLFSRRAVREKIVDRIMDEREVNDRRRARKYVERKLESMPAWNS